MAYSQLRIYNGPTDETPLAFGDTSSDSQNITLPVGDVLPLLADAVDSRRTWLRDFKNDDITISTDLYEVLLAYQHYRRSGA